jgi:hypothetical protein
MMRNMDTYGYETRYEQIRNSECYRGPLTPPDDIQLHHFRDLDFSFDMFDAAPLPCHPPVEGGW